MPTTGQLALLIAGLFGYVAAWGLALRRDGREGAARASGQSALLLAALAAGATLLTWRVLAAGTLLVVSGFESMVLIAWLIGAEVLVIRWSGRLGRADVFLLPLAVALQAGSLLMLRAGPHAVKHLREWHIVGHAGVIVLASACFIASGVFGLVYLLAHRSLRNKRALDRIGGLPPLETLERVGRGLVAVGFPLLTFGILTGICAIAHVPAEQRYAELLMSTGTFVVWLTYAVGLLVIWLRPQLRGPRAAWMACIASALTLINLVSYLLVRTHA